LRGEALLSALNGARGCTVKPPRLANSEPGNGAGVRPGAGTQIEGMLALIEEMGMEETLVLDLVRSFLDRSPVYLEEMETALEAGTPERVDRAAHTMKGMCGNLRFARLVELCERLRMAVRLGDAPGSASGMAALRAEYEAVSAVVQARWGPSETTPRTDASLPRG